MPESFAKLEFATEGDIEWAFAALTNHAHDVGRQKLAAARSRSAADERKLLQSVDQWVDNTRTHLTPNVEVDGEPWKPGQPAEPSEGPNEAFDTDLQAQVAEQTDRLEDLTEAAVRGRKEVPTARRDAKEEQAALRKRVQLALDLRVEKRRRRAAKALLKQVTNNPLPLEGIERIPEQASTLDVALEDAVQLELSLPQQSMAARQTAELIKRLTAASASNEAGAEARTG